MRTQMISLWAMHVWAEHTKLRTLALVVAKRPNIDHVNSFRSNIKLFLSLNIIRLDYDSPLSKNL